MNITSNLNKHSFLLQLRRDYKVVASFFIVSYAVGDTQGDQKCPYSMTIYYIIGINWGNLPIINWNLAIFYER